MTAGRTTQAIPEAPPQGTKRKGKKGEKTWSEHYTYNKQLRRTLGRYREEKAKGGNGGKGEKGAPQSDTKFGGDP